MNARKERREKLEPCAKCPHYTCSLLWDDKDDVLSTTTQYSLTTMPVPCVSIKELSNKGLMNTLHTNPHLFKIDCRINIKCSLNSSDTTLTSLLLSLCVTHSTKVLAMGRHQDWNLPRNMGFLRSSLQVPGPYWFHYYSSWDQGSPQTLFWSVWAWTPTRNVLIPHLCHW